jgi:flagellar biosynthesis/type III secretory pathway protein FliH
MTKVIKRAPGDPGDISPDTGFADGNIKRAGIIRGGVADARGEAQVIRERAEAEAAEIRERARLEAEEIKRQAHEAGLAEGRDAGAAQLAEVVARASQRLTLIEAQAVPQLRDLAVTIARKILGKELEFAPEAVVDIVKQALSEKARQRREIVLRVNPDDLAVVRERKPELLEVLSRAKEIGVREDPDVARHGVVIETDAGVIDAQLETQLVVFERVLKETR